MRVKKHCDADGGAEDLFLGVKFFDLPGNMQAGKFVYS